MCLAAGLLKDDVGVGLRHTGGLLDFVEDHVLQGGPVCAFHQRHDIGQDLRLVKLEGTSRVVRQAARTVTVSLRQISQLVLVQGTAQRARVRAGAHHVVYQLTLLSRDERLALIREILRQHTRRSLSVQASSHLLAAPSQRPRHQRAPTDHNATPERRTKTRRAVELRKRKP